MYLNKAIYLKCMLVMLNGLIELYEYSFTFQKSKVFEQNVVRIYKYYKSRFKKTAQ